MNPEDFKKRTMKFALDVIEFVETLPRKMAAEVICRQLTRSGTSVGANYRAACRAKSNADFIHKMGTVEEESDESDYWLALLELAKMGAPEQRAPLKKEAGELTAMTVASIRTAKRRP
jgi:four helix bundle protein